MDNTISILIPVFNHKKYIKELMDSIGNIKLPILEAIFLDDGSSDGSYEEIAKLKDTYNYPIRLFCQENLGIVRTMNRLSDLATSDLICFMASDDIVLPNRFDNALKEFKRNINTVVVYENGRYLAEKSVGMLVHDRDLENILSTGNANSVYQFIASRVPGFYIQGMTIRRDFFISIGGFCEAYIADDWALNLRIFHALLNSQHRFCYFHKPVFLYRIHETNIHKDKTRQFRMIDQIVENEIPETLKQSFDKDYAYFFLYFILTIKWDVCFMLIRKKGVRIILNAAKYAFTRVSGKVALFIVGLRVALTKRSRDRKR